MKGKLIVIEGTDCSGKETQSKKLIENLEKNNKKVCYFCFPNYESPTGKIVGGPYLGKSYICDGWFKEKAPNVDSKVSSLYFAADRKYNIHEIQEKLDKGINVVVDRYIDSNLEHQASKISSEKERKKMFHFLNTLEYKLLELPKADITIFLYMPLECAKILKSNRQEKPDQHEIDENYLLNSERMYLYLAKKKKYIKVDCSKNNSPKSIEDIQKEIMGKISKKV